MRGKCFKFQVSSFRSRILDGESFRFVVGQFFGVNGPNVFVGWIRTFANNGRVFGASILGSAKVVHQSGNKATDRESQSSKLKGFLILQVALILGEVEL
jgi:hypothetical protein